MPVPADYLSTLYQNPILVANMRQRGEHVRLKAIEFADADLQRSADPPGGKHYHDSFVTQPPLVRGRDLVVVIGNTALHATWIEHGTRPHIIRAVNASVLSFFWERKGEQFFGPLVHHPGTRPYMILARALAVGAATAG